MRLWTPFFLALAIAVSCGVEPRRTAAAAEPNDIGYPSVEAALQALRQRDDVIISKQKGWTVVEERAALTIWSFTPADHPAHPAVVKRQVYEENGAARIRMWAKCGAAKDACDALLEGFQRLNARMGEAIKREKTGK